MTGSDIVTPPIVPVVLCGGSGARLWPLSTDARPKPFLPLLDGRSTFQETLARAGAIEGVDTVLIVANQSNRDLIKAETDGSAFAVQLLLEPVGRDSAAAIAAAAAWLARHRPGVVAAFMSADHHVPDRDAFAAAIAGAARAALDHGVVALGLRPDGPSTAFGYIRPLPDGGAVARIGAFVEKPDRDTAERYIAAGYLWNSGNFVARPEALLAELTIQAPEIAAAASSAVAAAVAEPGATLLGPEFSQSPSISIDRALMERTTEAAVLPVGFAWSDIGSWRAVLSASPRDDAMNSLNGDVVMEGCTGCIVRMPPGIRVAMVGLKDIAIIANETGDLLVCDLAAGEDVRNVVRRLQTASRSTGKP